MCCELISICIFTWGFTSHQYLFYLILCCELISICIFTWGFTSSYDRFIILKLLWIDFNLYFYVRIHKSCKRVNRNICVVNWFQFVFLREDSQALTLGMFIKCSCELISICIFTWGFTRAISFLLLRLALWIDFNLYFYVRIHKNEYVIIQANAVVNWFQFVFLREDSQDLQTERLYLYSCELISICIFTWGFTRSGMIEETINLLWIDFNLYFYVRIHK